MTATHSMTSTQFEANVPSSTLFLHPGGFKRDVLTTGNNSLRRPGTELAFVNSITGERFKIWTICDFQKDDAYTNLPIFFDLLRESEKWLMGSRPDTPLWTWPMQRMQNRDEYNSTSKPSQPPVCGMLKVVSQDQNNQPLTTPFLEYWEELLFAFRNGIEVKVAFVKLGNMEYVESERGLVQKLTPFATSEGIACNNNCGRSSKHHHTTCCGLCGTDKRDWRTTTGHTPLCDRANNVYSPVSHMCCRCDRLTRDDWCWCCRGCSSGSHTNQCETFQVLCKTLQSECFPDIERTLAPEEELEYLALTAKLRRLRSLQ